MVFSNVFPMLGRLSNKTRPFQNWNENWPSFPESWSSDGRSVLGTKEKVHENRLKQHYTTQNRHKDTKSGKCKFILSDHLLNCNLHYGKIVPMVTIPTQIFIIPRGQPLVEAASWSRKFGLPMVKKKILREAFERLFNILLWPTPFCTT